MIDIIPNHNYQRCMESHFILANLHKTERFSGDPYVFSLELLYILVKIVGYFAITKNVDVVSGIVFFRCRHDTCRYCDSEATRCQTHKER